MRVCAKRDTNGEHGELKRGQLRMVVILGESTTDDEKGDDNEKHYRSLRERDGRAM